MQKLDCHRCRSAQKLLDTDPMPGTAPVLVVWVV
jgi:hypothetical protein